MTKSKKVNEKELEALFDKVFKTESKREAVDKFVMVHNDLIEQDYMGKYEMFIYVLLNNFHNTLIDASLISINAIIDFAGLKPYKNTQQSIKNVLINLYNNGVIEIYKDFKKQQPINPNETSLKGDTSYFFTSSYFHANDENVNKNFTKIYQSEMKKIINAETSSKNIKPSELLLTLYNIVKRIFAMKNEFSYCYPKVSTIASESNVSKHFASAIIHDLKQNGIINVWQYKDGKKKTIKNHYSRHFMKQTSDLFFSYHFKSENNYDRNFEGSNKHKKEASCEEVDVESNDVEQSDNNIEETQNTSEKDITTPKEDVEDADILGLEEVKSECEEIDDDIQAIIDAVSSCENNNAVKRLSIEKEEGDSSTGLRKPVFDDDFGDYEAYKLKCIEEMRQLTEKFTDDEMKGAV